MILKTANNSVLMLCLVAPAIGLLLLVPHVAAARKPYCHLLNMALVQNRFCIDRYEASTQIRSSSGWTFHSPFESVHSKEVRAVSRPNRYPQGYISRNEAAEACKRSNKRLCTETEWKTACKGKHPTQYPYGDTYREGKCNDRGRSPLNHYYGTKSGPPLSAYGWEPMNDPKLNQLRGTLAKTGSFRNCRNSWGLHDMVGNLHEWVDTRSGAFLGGYYLDTQINGAGCDYKTTAHAPTYHDYSTGFRCCSDPR